MSNGTPTPAIPLDWQYALEDLGCELLGPGEECPEGYVAVDFEGLGTFCCPPTVFGELPPEIAPPAPGEPPAIPADAMVYVSEEDCLAREAAAEERGRAAERNSFFFYTVAGSVISGLVGYALGRLLGE